MAKRTFLAGATSQTIDIFIQDSSSTVGAGLTGLVFNTASLTAYYRKGATGTPTAITLATQTAGGAWSSGGFVAVDGTNMPGVYRLDVPDTVFASTPYATIYLKGAANMAPNVSELEIVSYNPFDGVRLGLTALPNAAASASGGLPILGSNTTAISFTGGMTISNSGGSALTLSSSGSNGHGLTASGNGSGHGLLATGGATGNGISGVGGATSGNGINGAGTTNSRGINAAGAGSGSGFAALGGLTGNGIAAVGGGTSGNGINVTTTSGHGINLAPVGTNMHGILSTGGNGGTSDGIKAVAGTGGVPIRGDITGNITGAVSGAVGSVTGAVGSVASGGISAASFAANAIDAAALAADAGTEIGTAVWATAARTLTAGTNIQLPSNGLANVTAWTVDITGSLSGSVGSVTGLTASDVAAIKAKTDSLTFTVAGYLASDIRYVKGTLVTGSGTAGSPWGP